MPRWIPGLDLQIAKRAMGHMAYDQRITQRSIEAWDLNYPQYFADLRPVP